MNSTEQPAVAGPVEPTVRPALVERLRRNADSWLPTSDHTLEAHNLLTEAAAEIERLNAWALAYYQETRGAILAERKRIAGAWHEAHGYDRMGVADWIRRA